MLIKNESNYLKAYTYNLINAQRIQNVTAPLFNYFGFYLFTYRRVYDDGRIFHICSKSDWIQNCFNKELWISQQMQKRSQMLNLFETHHYTWIHDLTDPLYAGLKEYNIWNGLSVYKRYKNYTELIGFGSTKENCNVLDFYQSNPEVINQFIFFFKEQIQDILKDCENYLFPITTPETVKQKENKIQNFLNEIKVRRYFIDNNFTTYLTQREADSLKMIAKGKTIKETARVLSISPRTVEDYLENIKIKFEAYSKEDLLRAIGGL